jgi:hypothetical protein
MARSDVLRSFDGPHLANSPPIGGLEQLSQDPSRAVLLMGGQAFISPKQGWPFTASNVSSLSKRKFPKKVIRWLEADNFGANSGHRVIDALFCAAAVTGISRQQA